MKRTVKAAVALRTLLVVLAEVLWRTKARGLPLALLASFTLASGAADAADKFDLWIDAFTIPGFSVTSVSEETSTTATGQNFTQTVEGMVGTERVLIFIQKAGGGGFGRGGEQTWNSLKPLSRYFRVEDAQGYQRVTGPSISGGQLDYQSGRCRAILLGADRKSDYYRLVVSLRTCGAARSTISEYVGRIRPSNRDKNAADFAAFRQREERPPVATKSVMSLECDAAKSDSVKMASFMQSLSKEKLAEFISGGQSCTLFEYQR